MSKDNPRIDSTAGQPGPEVAALAQKYADAMLAKSRAFLKLSSETQAQVARHTARAAAYLVEPDGLRLPVEAGSPLAKALGNATLDTVNFPEFVAGLIQGVFQAIVNASIEQMEAYGRLIAEVSRTVDQFLDENISGNEGRDHLADEFPDVFQIETTKDGSEPRLSLRAGVDKAAALKRLYAALFIDHEPVSDLDDETIEKKLVPAARRHLARSRQQLLANMVLMGINRIVVTDGKKSDK